MLKVIFHTVRKCVTECLRSKEEELESVKEELEVIKGMHRNSFLI